MNEEDKHEYERLLSRAALQHMSESERNRLSTLSKMSIKDKMTKYEGKVTMTSKIDGKFITSYIDFSADMVYVLDGENTIFEGTINAFKKVVAKFEDSTQSKAYKEMLSLAEEVESVLSKGDGI